MSDGSNDGSVYTSDTEDRPASRPPSRSRSASRSASRKRPYSNEYRESLNAAIAAANGKTDEDQLLALEPSQIGAVTWSEHEKEVFFAKLATVGRDDIRSIAKVIGSKGESEVRDYILLLEDGVLEDSLTADRPTFGIGDVPAAFEVSDECDRALDQAADALAWQVEQRDEGIEIKRHGDYWLLTEETAEDIEDALAQNPEHEVETDSDDKKDHIAGTDTQRLGTKLPVPSAEVLNLRNWLQLSQIFMNHAPDLEAGWHSLIDDEDETPSMYKTAFDDFHNLTVSLTKKIMQASIFQALSRLRASDHNLPKEVVRAGDVEAAVSMMGLKDDWYDFWVHCARRHKLRVYTRENAYKADHAWLTKGHELSYDEVENALSQPANDEEAAPEQVVTSIEEEVDSDELYDNDDFWTETSTSEDNERLDTNTNNQQHNESGSEYAASEDAISITADLHQRKHRQTRDNCAEEKVEDAYLEALDQTSSKAEEARLWTMLGRTPPDEIKDEIKDEEEPTFPTVPTLKRKRLHEFRDWRDEIDYMPEWERYEVPVPVAAFADMARRGVAGRKRRKEAYEKITRAQGFVREEAGDCAQEEPEDLEAEGNGYRSESDDQGRNPDDEEEEESSARDQSGEASGSQGHADDNGLESEMELDEQSRSEDES